MVERDRLDAVTGSVRGCADAGPPTRWCWRLFREARNYSEKANVTIDYGRGPSGFVRAGWKLGTREPIGQGVDVPRVMRAARLFT